MPIPRNERQALEEELAELPEQIAAYQRELAATPVSPGALCFRSAWRIRRDKKRLAEIDARLAGLRAEP